METAKLVARRADFLQSLSTSPREKRDLVDELDYSRSTVDRAVRDLEMHGLVERTNAGYVTTVSGRVSVEQYRQFVETTLDTLELQELVDQFPPDVELDGRILRNASVDRADDTAPYTPAERLIDTAEKADRLRVLAVSLPDPRFFDVVAERSRAGELSVDAVVAEPLWKTLHDQHGEMLTTITETGMELSVGDVPAFDLLLFDRGEETTVCIVVFSDAGSILGVLTNDTPAAVEWAEQRFEHHRADAESVVGELMRGGTSAALADSDGESAVEGDTDTTAATESSATATADREDAPTATGETAASGETATSRETTTSAATTDPKDLTLEREGFVRLSETYFDRRAVDPVTCWQVGMELTEIRAGYAIDREYVRDGERRSLTDDLLAGLRAGADHALLGPPGTGKSTVCKRVACRWFENGDGPVFYRESGVGASFRSVTHLADRLRRTDGHALVVVEDVPRAEANAAVRLLQEFADADGVTFLFDARTNEWEDPPAALSARLDALRHEVVTTVTVPPLDERECDRLVERFASLADREVDLTGEDLLSGIRGDETDPEEATSGELLLVLHRLTQTAQRADSESATTTTLLEDVRDTYETLRAAGDDVLDVGVLVNLLNATGVGVRPELVHALADDGRRPTGGTNGAGDGGHRAVDDALAELEGSVLFERKRGEGSPYRTVHELWSTHFLEHLLDAEGTRDAQRRVGRVVTAFLSLADDAEARERIDWEFAGEAPGLLPVERDPTDWADSAVERLFQLGQDRPTLAPLYGSSAYSRIDLPEACSTATRLRVAEWRGRMLHQAGEYDDARREFELLAERAETADLPATRRTEFRALAHKHLGTAENDAGNYEAAADHYEEGLAHYRDLGQPKGQAQCLNNLGTVAYVRGDRAGAEDYFERSLEQYRELDAKTDVANTLNNLGVLARSRGSLAEGQEYHERSLALYEQVGTQQDVADALGNLGTVALDRGDVDAAERYARRQLDVVRDVGYPRGRAMALENLGSAARLRGDLDDAVASLEKALDILREVGDQWTEGTVLDGLGRAYRDRGDLDDAAATFRRLRELARDIESPERLGSALVGLASVALDRGDLDAARGYAEWCLDRGLGEEHVAATAAAHRLLAAVARRRGEFATAEERLTAAADLLEASDVGHERARVARERAEVSAARGDTAAARERFQAAADRFREAGATADAEATAARLGELTERTATDDGNETSTDAPGESAESAEPRAEDD
ncbi:Predicted transcriptional regulator, contains HTH domain [Halogranum gelatinilyticum]|uniref:Predicted transcriptional regulator, contains HTH domain n=2 Tax=Halogranum gelatinilyticum TaxID=660521 RepID=A0A1G9U678_9EURY|nr:Predicted transcriptional regulator, contains HTH domain [Halogranum gelatinilyticum]